MKKKIKLYMRPIYRVRSDRFYLKTYYNTNNKYKTWTHNCVVYKHMPGRRVSRLKPFYLYKKGEHRHFVFPHTRKCVNCWKSRKGWRKLI